MCDLLQHTLPEPVLWRLCVCSAASWAYQGRDGDGLGRNTEGLFLRSRSGLGILDTMGLIPATKPPGGCSSASIYR